MTTSEHEEYLLWLSRLQPGDEVAQQQLHRGPAIRKIYRTTKTQVITRNGQRFSKRNGHEIGANGRARIEPMTDSICQLIAEAADRARFRILSIEDGKLTHAEVRAMLDALDRERAGEKAV